MDEIIQIENDIARLYSKLYRLDISSVDKKASGYYFFINILNRKLKEEEELFESLNVDTLKIYLRHIIKERKKLNKRLVSNEFTDCIIERIYTRLHYFLKKKLLDPKGDIDYFNFYTRLNKTYENYIKETILAEQNNIIMFLLDEYASGCVDKNNGDIDSVLVRDQIIYYKYSLVFILPMGYEKHIINENFNICRRDCLKTWDCCISKLGDNKKYYRLKLNYIFCFANRFIDKIKYLNKIFYRDDKFEFEKKSYYLFCIILIRTCAYLMDDKLFQDFMSCLERDKEFCSCVKNISGIDIISTLDFDRDSYKYFSLVRKK